MGTLNFPGLATGIDTSALIAQLMAAKKNRLIKYRLDKKIYEERLSKTDELKTKLKALKSATAKIAKSESLLSHRANTSDNDIVTVSVGEEVAAGSYSVEVGQLAKAETWVYNGTGFQYKTDYVGGGSFIYSYNNQERVITTVGDLTTLEDLVNLINNDTDNPGVTASLLHQGDTYRLMLSGNQTGEDYQITVNSSNTEVYQADTALTVSDGTNAALTNRITELVQFSGSLAGGEQITITGTKHDGSAVSTTLSINANTTLDYLIDKINSDDAFGSTAVATLVDGKIVLTDTATSTSSMTLTLGYNQGTGSSTLTLPTISRTTEGGSVTNYLAALDPTDFLQTQNSQNAQLKIDGFGNWIESNSNTVTDAISHVTFFLKGTNPTGETTDITISRDTSLVAKNLETMLAKYNDVVKFLKENTEYDAKKKAMGMLSQDTALRFLKSQMRSKFTAAPGGFDESEDEYLLVSDIGIGFDGEGMMTLDKTVLNEAIEEDFDSVRRLLGAHEIGASDIDEIGFYGSSETYTTAGMYEVEVQVASGVITSAKIRVEGTSTWRDMTVLSGGMIVGDNTFDSEGGGPLYPENGLQLTVDLTSDGTFNATVSVKKGVGGAFEDFIEKFIKTGNQIDINENFINDRIDALKTKISREQIRMEKEETRLVAKFARLEGILAQMQQQMAAVGQISLMQ